MAWLTRRSTVAGLAAAAIARPAIVRAQGSATPVSTQLGWLRNGEYAALMVAEAKGFFAAEGIAHRIVDGGPGKNPVPIVAVGQATFGLAASGLFLLQARTAPDPVDVIAIGTLYQTTPGAYVTLGRPDDPDPTPKDLEGKSIGIQAGSEYILTALARKNGIDEKKVRIVTVQANAEPLLAGAVDYFSAWITNQTYQIEQEIAKPGAPSALKGKTWKALRLSKWGLTSYSDVFFCTPKTIKDNPDLVGRYLSAVKRAIAFIQTDPEEAVSVVAGFPGQIEDARKLAWRWRVQNPLYASAETAIHGPLWMTPDTWRDMAHFMFEYGQVPRLVPSEDVMTAAFLPPRT